MKTEAILSFSIPGDIRNLEDDESAKLLISILDEYKIEYKQVDTVAGWANLNQDWIEFTADIETSFSWCKILSFKEDWESILTMLKSGNLICVIHYKNDKGELIPHH